MSIDENAEKEAKKLAKKKEKEERKKEEKEKKQRKAEKDKAKKENIKESNKKAEKKSKLKIRTLEMILYVVLIILVSLISFVGIYVKDKNKMSNQLPEYILGSDIDSVRNIVVKVDTSTETKKYDANGNEINTTNTTTSNETDTEGTTTKEVAVNDSSLMNIDNYQKSRDVIEKRLKYMNVNYYEIKTNEADGTIYLEVPENDDTDYIANYCQTKGVFQVTDNDTGEVLLTNDDLENAKIQYNTTTSGTTVYLSIQFNKEGTEKLKDISNTYVQSTDSEGKSTTKKIKMSVDDSQIISTYFSEAINDGLLQLSIGTSSDSTEIKNYVKQAQNVAVFLNSGAMPLKYTSEVNRLVYSDITTQTLKTILIVLISIIGLLLVYMILKYKKLGILGALTNIGFIALLLIIIRYANVTVTLTGIFITMFVAIIEYLFLMNIFKVYSKNMNIEDKNKEVKYTINKELEKIVPIGVIAVVFTLMKWLVVYSIGMILFWSVVLFIIYNIIVLKVICPKEKLLKEED